MKPANCTCIEDECCCGSPDCTDTILIGVTYCPFHDGEETPA